MSPNKITYRQLVAIKNTVIGLVLLVLVMQSMVTYMLAVTIESQKEEIAGLVGEVLGKACDVHDHHVSYIEQKLDHLVVQLKAWGQKDSQTERSNHNTAFFFTFLYCENIQPFHFDSYPVVETKLVPSNRNARSLLWAFQQPRPPQI